MPAAQDAGLGLLPWSAARWRVALRQVSARQRPSGSPGWVRIQAAVWRRGTRARTERTWDVIDAVQDVAEARGISMAEVALAWVTDRPAVTSTILGARTVEQLEANLRVADLHLSREEIEALDAASQPRVADYPYGELGVEQRSRDLSGGR